MSSQQFIDPLYQRGEFYNKSTGEIDASYKVEQLRLLLNQNKKSLPNNIKRIADVGCGTGKTTFLLHTMMSELYGEQLYLDGFDVHPYIINNSGNANVTFYFDDFVSIAEGIYDLVVLFDVIEHVPDPVSFIKEISRHALLMAFHIPLDNSLLTLIRNLPRKNILYPGHIILLDLPSAINLLTISGLRVLDYDYSPGFLSPSGKMTIYQNILYPFRWLLYKVSPYLTQKLLACVSLSVIAWTRIGLENQA